MAKTKLKNKKAKKVLSESVVFNVSVPKSLLPKIDKKAKKYAKTNGLTKTSRSAFVRNALESAVRA